MLIVLFLAQLAIIFILLINGFEFTEVMWRPHWRREFALLSPQPGDPQPVVSIHLACCNEPPEMVILTLDSLAALDYENSGSPRHRQQHEGRSRSRRIAARSAKNSLLPSESVAGLQGRRAETSA